MERSAFVRFRRWHSTVLVAVGLVSRYHCSTCVRILSTIATDSIIKRFSVVLKWTLRGKSVTEFVILITDLFDLLP